MTRTPELISVVRAAEELGLTPTAIRHAIMRGSLRAVRIDGRTNVIERSALERYRREHHGRRGKRPRTANPPKQQAYQLAYYRRRKAARQQPATAPAEE